MKQNKLLVTLTSLALISTLLTACQNSTNEPNEPKSEIQTILDKLETGFTMNGVVTQSRIIKETNLATGEVSVSDKESQNYNVDILYENSSERVGTSVTHSGKVGELTSIIDYLSAYIDEEGNCYQEYLDYKNEVQVKYLKEGSNKLSFAAAGLYNFASILNEEDITYSEDLGAYTINKHKVGTLLANLLTRVNTGFMYAPSEISLMIKDGMFTTLDIKMENYEATEVENSSLIEISYSNSVSFKFADVGNTKLPRITPYKENNDNVELRSAMDHVKNNFTVDVESALSIDNGAYNHTYRMFKFIDDKILIHDYDDIHKRGLLKPNNHFVLQKLEGSESDLLYSHIYDVASAKYIKGDVKGFAKNYQGIYYFEDLIPSPSIVSSDFFTYDQNSNEYICEDDDVLEQIKPLLMTSKAPLQNDAALNANKIGIRVSNDGSLNYIKFYVKYKDLFNGSEVKGNVKLKFSKIGETTL